MPARSARVTGLSDGQEYVFPPFRLDGRDERLFHDGHVVPLKPKALAVLCRLLEERGRLVRKKELLDDLWSDVTVGEAVLKVCIREIRAALGDDPDSPRFIETVHGRGYRFIGAVEEPRASAPRARAFVGRARELEILWDALDQATAGRSRVLVITGEPGIGKTALVETFLGALAAPSCCVVAHGRCTAHQGQREPYMPMLEALGRICRAADGRPLQSMIVRYAPTWAVQLPGLLTPEQLSAAQARVTGATLGRMLREMGDLIEALSQEKPVVLSIEDLHWSDRSTLDLLGYLAKRQSNARLLILGTSRSRGLEQQDASPSSQRAGATDRLSFEEVPLLPLSVELVEELLEARFGRPDWAPRVAGRLHRQTGGNPLFLSSVMNHLAQTSSARFEAARWIWHENAETWRVPRELRAFIQHWFGQGSPDAKKALEAASVLGREFDPALLAALLEVDAGSIHAECELQVTRGFLDRDFESPLYRFVHALFQQVLYESLPHPTRVAYHRRIAECLEKLPDTAPARLAHHYEQGQAYVQAVEYHARAGESAHQRYAYHEAVEHLERAHGLLQHIQNSSERSDQELRILLSLGQPLINIQGWTTPAVERIYRRGYELCEKLGPAPRFAVLAGLYKFFVARGHVETAAQIAEQCQQCAEEVGYRPLLMTAHVLKGIVAYLQGDLTIAETELETSRALYDFAECQTFAQLFGDDPAVGALGFLGRVTYFSGDEERARALGREGVALARRINHPHVIASGLAMAAHLEAWCEKDAAVSELVAELSQIAKTQSFALWTVVGRFFSAWVRCRAGDQSALEDLRTAFAEYDAFGAVLDRPTYAALLAGVCTRLRRPELAREVIDEALATPPRLPVWDDRLRYMRGERVSRVRLRAQGKRPALDLSRRRPA